MLIAQPSPVSNLRTFLSVQTVLYSFVTPPWASPGLSSKVVGEARSLMWSTVYPTPRCMPLGSSYGQQVCVARHSQTGGPLCIPCQTSKVQRHIRAPLQVPCCRFDHIHMDLVGPLPPSNGFTHLFTVVDQFARWPEAIPLSNMTTHVCAQASVAH